jgi:hypothetical protein
LYEQTPFVRKVKIFLSGGCLLSLDWGGLAHCAQDLDENLVLHLDGGLQANQGARDRVSLLGREPGPQGVQEVDALISEIFLEIHLLILILKNLLLDRWLGWWATLRHLIWSRIIVHDFYRSLYPVPQAVVGIYEFLASSIQHALRLGHIIQGIFQLYARIRPRCIVGMVVEFDRSHHGVVCLPEDIVGGVFHWYRNSSIREGGGGRRRIHRLVYCLDYRPGHI